MGPSFHWDVGGVTAVGQLDHDCFSSLQKSKAGPVFRGPAFHASQRSVGAARRPTSSKLAEN